MEKKSDYGHMNRPEEHNRKNPEIDPMHMICFV